MNRLFLIFFFLLFPFYILRADDYIIVGTPNSISILNQFEQNLSSEEYDRLGSYPCFRVILHDGTLGDGITPAIKVETLSQVYYLLKDGEGIAGGKNTYVRIFKNCRSIDDTVEVIKGGTVIIHQAFPSGGPVAKAGEGQQLFRHFSYEGYCYVSNSGGKITVWGWCPVEQTIWRRIKLAKDIASDTTDIEKEEILKRIKTVVENANKSYVTFFNHFNQLTSSQKSIPQWSLSPEGKQWIWMLSEPWRSNGQLDDSSQELAQKLAVILVGKPYRVTYERGCLAITGAKE